MRTSTYSLSPYGKMRDRMAEEQKRKEAEKRKRKEDYYTWLVSGR